METIKRSELMELLGPFKKVYNCVSPRTRNKVIQQFDLVFERGYAFQSYGTLIAAKTNGHLYLTEYHNWSRTTCKYANEWTGYNTEERKKGLKDGRFILVEDSPF